MDKDYSLNALGQFHDYAANKGLLKKETALSRKRAALKVLSILESNENNDLRSVDLDEVFRRFETLKGSEFKPASLQVYHSRLKSAVSDFLTYVESPSTFKPSVAPRTSSKAVNSKKGPSNKPEEITSGNDQNNSQQQVKPPSFNNTGENLTIPIPLRNGLTVLISNMPMDLSAKEAEKLATIIKAYAMED